MALPQYPFVNGKRFDYSSIIIALNGKQYLGVKEISYDLELKPGELWGTSAQKIGRTRGQAKPSGSMSVYREEMSDLIAFLQTTTGVAQAVLGFMEVSFPIMVLMQEGLQIQTDLLVGARISKISNTFSASSDALMSKLDLDLMDIRFAAGVGGVPAPAYNVLK